MGGLGKRPSGWLTALARLVRSIASGRPARARAETGASPYPSVRAHIDGIRFSPGQGWQCHGWAADPGEPARRLWVQVLHRGALLAEGEAESFRPDLVAAGIGDGHHAFVLPLPDHLALASGPLDLVFRIRGDENAVDVTRRLAADPVVGWIDGRNGIVVRGWACNVLDPARPLMLDILLDDVLVDRVRADDRRGDLLDAGLGDAGYQWVLPDAFIDGRERRLGVRVANGTRMIPVMLPPIAVRPQDLTPETRRWLYFLRVALRDAGGGTAFRILRPPAEGVMAADIAALDVLPGRSVAAPGASAATRAVDVNATDTVRLSDRDMRILFGPDGQPSDETATVRGRLARVGEVQIGVWLDRGPVADAAIIDILIDGLLVDSVAAAPDDGDAGSRRLAMTWTIPLAYCDGLRHSLSARLSNTSVDLPGSFAFVLESSELDRDAAQASAAAERQRRTAASIRRALVHEGSMVRQGPLFSALDLLLDRGMDSYWIAAANAPDAARSPGSARSQTSR